MNTTTLKKPLWSAGPQSRVVWVKFTPNGTSNPTVAESHGCSATVTYSDVGEYVVSLGVNALKAICVLNLSCVPGDSNYHELVYAESVSAKTITVNHRTVAYAAIEATGPAASNTCGQITLAVLCREGS